MDPKKTKTSGITNREDAVKAQLTAGNSINKL